MIQITSPLQEYLQELCAELTSMRSGEVASYIPELSHAKPDWFGIAIATADGHVYEVGDSQQLFTIQSISKPLVYGLALEDHGRERVLAKVGVEPTGEAFNSIVLESQTDRPFNPMVNAGAIATAGPDRRGETPEQQLNAAARDCFAAMRPRRARSTKRSMSETITGHRNRAIAPPDANFGMWTDASEESLESISSNARCW